MLATSAVPAPFSMIKSVLAHLRSSNRKYSKFSKAETATKEDAKLLETKKKELAQIASRLKQKNPGERRQALLDIAQKDVASHLRGKAFDLLALGMADSEADVRYTAVMVLAHVSAHAFENAVEDVGCGPCGLESPDMDARIAAARATGRMVCPIDAKAAAMLANRLVVHECPDVQEAAAQVLCEVGLQIYQKAMQIISHGFEHSDAAVRKDSINFIALVATSSNSKHSDIISRGLKDPNAEVRLAAQNAKAKIDYRSSETALELFMAHTLEKSDAAVRRAAMSAVGRLGNVSEDDPCHGFCASSGSKVGHQNADQSARRGGA